MKPKRLPYKKFLEIYSKVPRLCIELIIKTKDGVVLSKRDIVPYKGMWHFPGGTVLFNEKLENTIQRIAKEETGLTVKVGRLIGTMQFIKSPIRHTISIGFLVTPVSGILRGSTQGKEIKFFKKIPSNTIKIQSDFLKKNNLLK